MSDWAKKHEFAARDGDTDFIYADADAFFPEIDDDWEKNIIKENKDNKPTYKHVEYLKKKLPK